MKELSLEEKFAKIKDFRPIDDIFFEILASDVKVCEEILQTIIGDKLLTVTDVIVQSSERNLYGRSVRLDALCTLGDGTRCNIEVQRSDNDNHLKRVRYNASCITTRETNPGDAFDDVPELYVVYISEFDFLKGGLTTYHVDKVIRENGVAIDDGLHEIYVNTVVDDGTDIADLMNCFVKKEFNNPKFPNFSNKVIEIKSTERGATAMCELMEKYMAESKAAGIAEGKAAGIVEGKREQLISLVNKKLLSIADAAAEADMSEEEFKLLLS